MNATPERTKDYVLLAVILAGSAAYAVARYVIFGPIIPANIPAYVINKVFAISAAAAILAAGWAHVRDRPGQGAFWIRASGVLAIVHSLLSLCLLSPAYYAKFYGEGMMNLTGELTVLLGVLNACIYLAWLKGVSLNPGGRLAALLACLLLAGHVLVMGMASWMTPAKWNGGMPPITLIGFVLALAGVILFAARPANTATITK